MYGLVPGRAGERGGAGQPAGKSWATVGRRRGAAAAIGSRPAPAARATYERAMAQARAQLGAEAFAAAWVAGQAMSLEQAITDALSEVG
jgi:hypothetical protein